MAGGDVYTRKRTRLELPMPVNPTVDAHPYNEGAFMTKVCREKINATNCDMQRASFFDRNSADNLDVDEMSGLGSNTKFGVDCTVLELREILLDLSKIGIKSVPYKDVDIKWNILYSNSVIIYVYYYLLSNLEEYSGSLLRGLTKWDDLFMANLKLLKMLDLSIIVSGAVGWRLEYIHKLIGFVKALYDFENYAKSHTRTAKYLAKDGEIGSLNEIFDALGPSNTKVSKLLAQKPPILRHQVKRYQVPLTVLEFSNIVNLPQEDQYPFIIENAITHWGAFNGPTRWSNMEYLRETVGSYRVVPVEIGPTYLDSTWSQKLVYFGDFLDNVLMSDNSSRPIVYLAQHNLFSQVPKLKNDFLIPDYCYVNNNRSSDYNNDEVKFNVWIGPENTVSPLHYDKYFNIYSQVVGEKYVKLVHPKYSTEVYPHPCDSLLENSSMVMTALLLASGYCTIVDAEHPDYIKFPLFEHIEYLECVVRPGDLLFIPLVLCNPI
ncbi:Lysine-specific demethylase 8 [Zancudomyces culisetae]|uniref:Lysine-specific demethylase 8 n=1 Tax=Zancudomyces culisetae TaxID=1213189 RepID=A0A1R1PUJ1_ZANCU|nr:Lysine-specific demethylase 8 [Zancudomyces culisetae]|eukprot:OMH84646.1 Lysine-specific demethylase 8 [Zancudomyces culisetae]